MRHLIAISLLTLTAGYLHVYGPDLYQDYVYHGQEAGSYATKKEWSVNAGDPEEFRLAVYEVCSHVFGDRWRGVRPDDMVFYELGVSLVDRKYYCGLVNKRFWNGVVVFYGPAKTRVAKFERLITDNYAALEKRRQINSTQIGPRILGYFKGGRIEEFISGSFYDVAEKNYDFAAEVFRKMALLHTTEVPTLEHSPFLAWYHISVIVHGSISAIQAGKGRQFPPETEAAIQRFNAFDFNDEVNFVKSIMDDLNGPLVYTPLRLGDQEILYNPNGPVGGQVLLEDIGVSFYFYRGYSLAMYLNSFEESVLHVEPYPHFREVNYQITARNLKQLVGEYLTAAKRGQLVTEAEVSQVIEEIRRASLLTQLVSAMLAMQNAFNNFGKRIGFPELADFRLKRYMIEKQEFLKRRPELARFDIDVDGDDQPNPIPNNQQQVMAPSPQPAGNSNAAIATPDSGPAHSTNGPPSPDNRPSDNYRAQRIQELEERLRQLEEKMKTENGGGQEPAQMYEPHHYVEGNSNPGGQSNQIQQSPAPLYPQIDGSKDIVPPAGQKMAPSTVNFMRPKDNLEKDPQDGTTPVNVVDGTASVEPVASPGLDSKQVQEHPIQIDNLYQSDQLMVTVAPNEGGKKYGVQPSIEQPAQAQEQVNIAQPQDGATQPTMITGLSNGEQAAPPNLDSNLVKQFKEREDGHPWQLDTPYQSNSIMAVAPPPEEAKLNSVVPPSEQPVSQQEQMKIAEQQDGAQPPTPVSGIVNGGSVAPPGVDSIQAKDLNALDNGSPAQIDNSYPENPSMVVTGPPEEAKQNGAQSPVEPPGQPLEQMKSAEQQDGALPPASVGGVANGEQRAPTVIDSIHFKEFKEGEDGHPGQLDTKYQSSPSVAAPAEEVKQTSAQSPFEQQVSPLEQMKTAEQQNGAASPTTVGGIENRRPVAPPGVDSLSVKELHASEDGRPVPVENSYQSNPSMVVAASPEEVKQNGAQPPIELSAQLQEQTKNSEWLDSATQPTVVGGAANGEQMAPPGLHSIQGKEFMGREDAHTGQLDAKYQSNPSVASSAEEVHQNGAQLPFQKQVRPQEQMITTEQQMGAAPSTAVGGIENEGPLAPPGVESLSVKEFKGREDGITGQFETPHQNIPSLAASDPPEEVKQNGVPLPFEQQAPPQEQIKPAEQQDGGKPPVAVGEIANTGPVAPPSIEFIQTKEFKEPENGRSLQLDNSHQTNPLMDAATTAGEAKQNGASSPLEQPVQPRDQLKSSGPQFAATPPSAVVGTARGEQVAPPKLDAISAKTVEENDNGHPIKLDSPYQGSLLSAVATAPGEIKQNGAQQPFAEQLKQQEAVNNAGPPLAPAVQAPSYHGGPIQVQNGVPIKGRKRCRARKPQPAGPFKSS
ncbi:hypothetical protein HDE_12777 [Halotydeus destructor]|nr:hypothetical protein HDE_12777 [Halotydeus destructor]